MYGDCKVELDSGSNNIYPLYFSFRVNHDSQNLLFPPIFISTLGKSCILRPQSHSPYKTGISFLKDYNRVWQESRKKRIYFIFSGFRYVGKTHLKKVFLRLDHKEGGGVKPPEPLFLLLWFNKYNENHKKNNKKSACHVQCWSMPINRSIWTYFIFKFYKVFFLSI